MTGQTKAPLMLGPTLLKIAGLEQGDGIVEAHLRVVGLDLYGLTVKIDGLMKLAIGSGDIGDIRQSSRVLRVECLHLSQHFAGIGKAAGLGEGAGQYAQGGQMTRSPLQRLSEAGFSLIKTAQLHEKRGTEFKQATILRRGLREAASQIQKLGTAIVSFCNGKERLERMQPYAGDRSECSRHHEAALCVARQKGFLKSGLRRLLGFAHGLV